MTSAFKNPPNFKTPKTVESPEVKSSFGDTTYIQDGILFRTYKTIPPL